MPPDAVQMFKAANALSGLSGEIVPRELIPLNARQIARGVLNYAMLQNSPGWVLPFWAERQYDPGDPAFIPRSHLSVSLNVTHRNWTAVGSPSCAVEPIIDPRGLATPFPGKWSIDTWIQVAGRTIFPSRLDHVEQRLIDDLPIVETTLSAASVKLRRTAYTAGSLFLHRVTVTNIATAAQTVRVALAIRPFNPEGVSPIHSLEFNQVKQQWSIDGSEGPWISRKPDGVMCSTQSEGDSAAMFDEPPRTDRLRSKCPSGLANGFAWFTLELPPGGSHSILSTCRLDSSTAASGEEGSDLDTRKSWNSLLANGSSVQVPDGRLQRLTRASLSTLMMLTEDSTITPGPSIYHEFWFRDAAYMLVTLLRFGHCEMARRVLESYPRRQDRSGYFRSQQGEWDSNGQALWTIWQYVLLARDKGFAESVFDSLERGVRWIETKRLGERHRNPETSSGLLPAGLSAEHLGLADSYFWDNFWSLAGIEAFACVCRLLGREAGERSAMESARRYREDIEASISAVRKRLSLRGIPASPSRGVDHGMIGTCSALHPLQILPAADPRVRATLAALSSRFLRKGMFFQQFIHSGLNPYLTMHLAHAWLLVGDRHKFLKLFAAVCGASSPTLNFPEAIHPLTGGGVMGDGHHGWASAEILLALRDSIVHEVWSHGYASHELVFLAGIPPEWFTEGGDFAMHNVPVPEGQLQVSVSTSGRRFRLTIALEKNGLVPSTGWSVRLPSEAGNLKLNGRSWTSGRQPAGVPVPLPHGTSRCELIGSMRQRHG